MTFKFLAADGLSSALEAISPVLSEVVGCSLKLSEEGDYYPGTNSRIATLTSSVEKGVLLGMLRILSITSQCGPGASKPGSLRLTVIMPLKSISMLIGVKGANIHALMKTSGAHVQVEGEAFGFSRGKSPSYDRLVHATGSQRTLETATNRLVECVQEFVDHPWFPKWAARTNADRCEQGSCDMKVCKVLKDVKNHRRGSGEDPEAPVSDEESQMLGKGCNVTPGMMTMPNGGMGSMVGLGSMGAVGCMGGMTASMGGMNCINGMSCMGGMGGMVMVPMIPMGMMGMGAIPTMACMSMVPMNPMATANPQTGQDITTEEKESNPFGDLSICQ